PNHEEMDEFDYEVVSNITEDMLLTPSAIVVETLGENYHEVPIEGIGIVNESGHYFIPTDVALASDIFKTWAEDKTKLKHDFDVKKTTVVFRRHDIHMKGIAFDLLLATYLLNPAEKHDDITSIAMRMGLNKVQHDEAVYGKGAKQKIPEMDVLSEHVTGKAVAIDQLQDQLVEQMQTNNLDTLFYDLEMPLALILGEMEHVGVQVDISRLEQMGDELTKRLTDIEEEIFSLAGESFNVNSPKQLGTIL